jgi:hypothetical protein
VHPAPELAKEERPRDLQRARQQQQASGVRKPLHDQGETWIFGSSARSGHRHGIPMTRK